MTNGILNITVHDPKVGDYFANWTDSATSEFNAYASEWRVDKVLAPSPAGMQYFEGVAPLGKYCTVLISHVTGHDDGSETVSVIVGTRYNDLIASGTDNVDFPGGVNGALDRWRDACHTGRYVPSAGDGNIAPATGVPA